MKGKFFRSGESTDRRKLRAMVESQKAAEKAAPLAELGEGTPQQTRAEDAELKRAATRAANKRKK